jgi:DNA-binding Lrp family transcriptional regulator
MAGVPQVSHCYERPLSTEWHYNLYTMLHAKSRESCRKIAQEISRKTGIKDYRLLYSTKEFKKTSMRYFNENP